MADWTRRHLVAWIVSIVVFSGIFGGLTGTVYAGAPSEDQTVVPLSDGFEGDGHVTSRCEQGCPPTWERDTSDVHTGMYAMHAADVATPSDKSLLPFNVLIIPANASAASLTFWHRFDFEVTEASNFFDGGVLEVSTDDGGTWDDAGSSITAGGYNGTIADIPTNNPLAGRAGWVGTIADWQQVSVDLRPYRGESFTFRLRLGTDASNITTPAGWWVDDIQVSYQAPLASCARAWSAARSYPVAVDQAAAVGLDGTVYVFGGMTLNGETANASKYSAQTNEWTPIASLPEARVGASAVTDGTHIYVFGGAAGARVFGTLWRYDPAANNYATLSPMNVGTAYHAAAFLPRSTRGVIYRIGGTIDAVHENFAKPIEAYSIASDTWANNLAEHPEALGRLAALGLGGYVYTAGGSGENYTSRKTYRYDPESDVWEDGQIADLPGVAGTTGALYKGVWLLNAGGAALGWDPAGNRWRSFDQVPQLVGGTGAVAGDAFYLVGGVARMAPSTAVQRYVETDCALPTATATPPLAATPTLPTGAACIGDCADDRMVSVADLVRGVSIALGNQPLSGCPSFDGDRNGTVAVNELVAAVNNALNGCA